MQSKSETGAFCVGSIILTEESLKETRHEIEVFRKRLLEKMARERRLNDPKNLVPVTYVFGVRELDTSVIPTT